MRPEDGDEKEDARIASKMTTDFQDAEGRVKDGVTRVQRTTKQLMAAYKIEIEEAKSGIKELKLIKEKEIHAFEKLKSDIKDCMDQRAQLEARIEQMELDQEMIKDSLKMAQGLKQKTWQDLIDAGGHIGAVQALKESLVEVRQEIMQTKAEIKCIEHDEAAFHLEKINFRNELSSYFKKDRHLEKEFWQAIDEKRELKEKLYELSMQL